MPEKEREKLEFVARTAKPDMRKTVDCVVDSDGDVRVSINDVHVLYISAVDGKLHLFSVTPAVQAYTGLEFTDIDEIAIAP